MKKSVLAAVFVLGISGFVSAAGFETKGNVFLGVNPVSSKYNSSEDENETDFDSAYLEADAAVSNDYVTAGGKVYYRLSKYDDSKDVDTDKTLAQKIEIKRAYLRVRPFGSELLEISGGKLYSYYLPGNFFSLSEIYTGASRWGKTGVGAKFEKNGFTVGAALPVTESYLEFANNWGINSALVYDFKNLNKDFPVKLGATWLYEYTYSESKDSKNKNKINSEKNRENRYTVSANYAPSFKGFVSKLNTTLSYSYNAEPYIGSSVFKNISNYSEIGDSWFFSINHRNNFSKVEVVLESEIGHCIDEDIVPVYGGIQLLVPVVKHIDFKPRFYYFGAFNTEDGEKTRQSLEWYPRMWLTYKNWILSAGCDFSYKEYSDKWIWEWSIPTYIEYKFDVKNKKR